MRRLAGLAAILSMIVLSGCKSQHPSAIKIDPDFEVGRVGTILVLPVISSITKSEDPARESETLAGRMLWEQLSVREDYSFLSPEQFRLALDRAELGTRFHEFNDNWIRGHVLHEDLLGALNSLNVDIILVPQVYLWQKDEADYRETATASATQVGITLSMVDPKTGKIVWEATDENYKEAVRTEGERIQASTGGTGGIDGIDRRISGRTMSGKDVYAAPPFDDVTLLVLQSLVGAIPEKVINRD